MIELDETNVEYVRCTCVDRAVVALRQSGQIHCSAILERLQIQFDELSELRSHWDPSKPCAMLDDLIKELKND